MALRKEFLEKHEDDVAFYRVFSDCGKNVLQVETGIVYDDVCITDDDPYTYEEEEPVDEYGNPIDDEATPEELMEALEAIL